MTRLLRIHRILLRCLAILRRVVRLLPVRWRVRLAVVVGRVFEARP